MKNGTNWRTSALFVIVVLLLLLMAAACSSRGARVQQATPASSEITATVAARPSATNEPSGLIVRDTPIRPLSSPYPFTTPLPPPVPTSLDGIYAKLEVREGTPVPCRRCPDYLPYGGTWTLSLDRGVYRVYFQVTDWRSVGSFSVSGDQIAFFNDPNCTDDVGTYQWKLDKGFLTLKVIQDPCMIGLRGTNFSARPWASCQPPNREAAISDHWPKPAGC